MDKTICKAVKADGTPCKAYALEGMGFCRAHAGQAEKAPAVLRDDLPDFSGGLCAEHFPLGWPDGAESAGCAHGSFARE